MKREFGRTRTPMEGILVETVELLSAAGVEAAPDPDDVIDSDREAGIE